MVLDYTGRREIKVGQLCVFATGIGYNSSPGLRLGVVTRFTPARVYYEGWYIADGWNGGVSRDESWTPKRRYRKYVMDNGKRVKVVESEQEYCNAVVLEDNFDPDELKNAMTDYNNSLTWAKD